jgi:hypothetical protein
MKSCRIALPILLLAGCNAAPLDYTPVDGIKSGPGMFSGAEGGFTMRSQQAQDAPPAATPAVKPVTPAISAEEYREFQDWREWKRQREEAGKK